MKKNSMVALGFLMTIAFTSSIWAGDIKIEGSGTGGDLVFKASPNTLMDTATSATAFTLTSASSKTTKENGIEYCLISADGYIYQMKQAEDYKVTKAVTAGEEPTGFAVKGVKGETTGNESGDDQ